MIKAAGTHRWSGGAGMVGEAENAGPLMTPDRLVAAPAPTGCAGVFSRSATLDGRHEEIVDAVPLRWRDIASLSANSTGLGLHQRFGSGIDKVLQSPHGNRLGFVVYAMGRQMKLYSIGFSFFLALALSLVSSNGQSAKAIYGSSIEASELKASNTSHPSIKHLGQEVARVNKDDWCESDSSSANCKEDNRISRRRQ